MPLPLKPQLHLNTVPNKNVEGNCICHIKLTITFYKTNTYIYIHIYPNVWYIVAIKGQEHGFTQAFQWDMEPLQKMVNPIAIKSQTQKDNNLHNQNEITQNRMA